MTDLALAPVSDSVADITRLIQAGIERGMNVETMERLVALHERMTDLAARREFSGAIADFQRECALVPRLTPVDYVTNKGIRVAYDFSSADDIVRTAKPLLDAGGFSYSFSSPVLDGEYLVTTCTLLHRCGQSRQSSIPIPIENGNPGMSPAQKIEAAQTIGQRRSLAAVLGLVTTSIDRAITDRTRGGESDELITSDQAAKIERMISSAGADLTRFCAYMRITSVPQLRARDYERALLELELKQREREKKS